MKSLNSIFEALAYSAALHSAKDIYLADLTLSTKTSKEESIQRQEDHKQMKHQYNLS